MLLGLGAAAIGATGFGGLRLISSSLSGVHNAAAQDINYFRIGGGGVGSRLYQLAGSYMFSTINHGGVLPDQLALLRLSATGWERV